MNIFILDQNTELCAKFHVDKHVVKMILESAQLLSTAARSLGFDVGYKQTHVNHPCSKWVRESFGNFSWLCDLTTCLNNEFKHRFGKDHKSFLMLKQELFPLLPAIKKRFQEKDLLIEMTKFALAMPEGLRSEDAVDSYRRYYLQEKRDLAKWTKRDPPDWWK